jgi:SWI/SNF-related matrix-associated actin-dependent regulator of chromatin subfamily A3
MDATPYMTLKRPYPFGTDHAPILHYGQLQRVRDVTPIDESLYLLGSVRLIQPD